MQPLALGHNRAIVQCIKQGTMSAPNPVQFDEMHAPDGSVREAYTDYQQWLSEQDAGWMRRKGAEAESFFRRTGITFNVYGDDDAEERLIPFDMVPRIISAASGGGCRAGSSSACARSTPSCTISTTAGDRPLGPPARAAVPRQQRLAAADGRVHPAGRGLHAHRRHRPRAHRARRVPRARGQRAHAVGRQLHAREPRDDDGDVPRAVHAGEGAAGLELPAALAKSLAAVRPAGAPDKPAVAVLTPGIYNSAYFEHAFLADQMGAELVEGSDLRVVDGGCRCAPRRASSRST
jgi:hypothetical protein